MIRLRYLALPAVLIFALGSPSPAVAWEAVVPRLHDLTDHLLDPQIDPEGNVVVAATFDDLGCGSDYLVTSLAAADGGIRWRRESSSDRGSSGLGGMAMDRRGDVVAVGYTDGRDDCCETCRARQAVQKLDGATGATLWQGDRAEGSVRAVAIDAADDVFVVRSGESDGYRLTKMSGTNGSVRWQGDVSGMYRWTLAIDETGNVAVESSNALTEFAGTDGRMLWRQDTRGEVRSLAIMPGGDLIAVEWVQDAAGGAMHIVRRRGATGEEIWRTPYLGSQHVGSIAVALGPGGSLFSSGGYYGEQPWLESRGIFVARLDAATGEEEWRYDLASKYGDGRVNYWDGWLVVDRDGDAVVQWSDGESPLHLSKISGTGVGEVWRRRPRRSWRTNLSVSETGTLVLAQGYEDIAVETRSVLTGTVLPCGDGHIDAGEACDDANAANGDGCDANCTASRCGNGEVGCAEECDDGNAESGDGCSPGCVAERPCGLIDLRGAWDFEVVCDAGVFGIFEYLERVELTQDCEAGLVTLEQSTGCDVSLPGWPTAGFACETTPVPLVGRIDGFHLRIPPEGTIHTTLTSPVAIPVSSSCSFTQLTADTVFPGRISQSYPGRAHSVSGAVDGTYTVGGPGSESCSAPGELSCGFGLTLVEAPALQPDPDQPVRAAAADLSVLLAQQECSSNFDHACSRLHARLTPWIERARHWLEAAASAMADDQPRGLRALKRALRALSVTERLTERRSRAMRGECGKGIHSEIVTIRQAVGAIRRDLAVL